jgi:hypothetical protein
MQRQSPQWQEEEKGWANEWARACEIWEQMEEVVADPRFVANSTAPNSDSEGDGIEMAAADPTRGARSLRAYLAVESSDASSRNCNP